MASRRILTRNSKKEAIRHEAIRVMHGKNVGGQPLQSIDGENASANVSGGSLNKSFPQPNDAYNRKFTKRKATEADNPCKQRHALSEQSVNTLKNPCDSKNEHPSTQKTDDSHSSTKMEESPVLFETPATDVAIATPGTEDITQEEISVLEEQMSRDELTMEDTNTGLTPYLKDNTLASGGQPHDSFMEVDPLKEIMRRRASRKVRLPCGVHDIDKFPDTLHTTIYSQDIHHYLQMKENEYRIPESFLDGSPELTPRMRGVCIDWLLRVQPHEDLRDVTLHMCVCLIDRYLSLKGVRLAQLQLLGITSLLIAAKFSERFAPEIATLCYLTSNTFEPWEVIHFERRMLMLLHFDLAFPVCTTFLDRYLQVHEDVQPKEVDYLSRYLVDLSTTRVTLAIVLPSQLAASAVYLARRLVIGIDEAWTSSLAYYTKYQSPADICNIINELAQVLLRAPTSKFQGAREKYNTKDYAYISHSKIVSPEVMESHFAAPTASSASAEPSAPTL